MPRGRPKKNPKRIEAFSENLNTIMIDKGITNQQLADAFGFKHVSQISYWRAGYGMPTPANLKLLAEVLQVKQSQLTGQELADKLEINRETITQWENGKRIPKN